MTHQTSYFLLVISTGRLEATASADGDIGWSSQLDHSKELDLYFSELYWSSFLGYIQKKLYRSRMAYRGKNVFVCFRTEIEPAHANRLFITKLQLMIGTVFYGEKNFDALVGHNSGPKSQFRNFDKKCLFVCFRTEIESAHANRLFSTKLPLMIGTVFYGEKTSILWWGIIGVRSHNFNIVTKISVCMFSHGNRISARKSAFHHKVATNDRYSFL